MPTFKMKFTTKQACLICLVPMIIMTASCKKEDVAAQEIVAEKEHININSHVKTATEKVNDLDIDALNKVEGISNKIRDEITNYKTNEKNEISANKIPNNDSVVMPLNNIYVVDGDTIHAVNSLGESIKIRMTGIDAPEKSQPMGNESSLSLSNCVKESSDIKLIAKKDNLNDKYGRYLGKVMVGSTDCNLYQVEKGMAWFYEDFADNLPDGEPIVFKNAQENARANRSGVWVSNPIAPWEYRESNR